MANTIRRRLGTGYLAASILLVIGLTLVGCGRYGLITPAGVPPRQMEHLLAHPERYQAFGCAPTRGPRAGEWVAMYWDIKGDGVRIVGEGKPARYGDRWQLLAPDQVAKVRQAVMNLAHQHETFQPYLNRILDERGRLIGWFFSARTGATLPVNKVRKGLYTIREVFLERFKWGGDYDRPLFPTGPESSAP